MQRLYVLEHRQWGKNIHGSITFPISFTLSRVIVATHQGTNFMLPKISESNSLSSFTLSVRDIGGNVDNSVYCDAQWVAIGI